MTEQINLDALVERWRRESKKLREADTRNGLVTMRPASANMLADDLDEAATTLTTLSLHNAKLVEALERMVAAYTGDWVNCEEAIEQARQALNEGGPTMTEIAEAVARERCSWCNYPLPAHSDICTIYHAQKAAMHSSRPVVEDGPCSEDMIEAANSRIQDLFAETAILLTHPNEARRASAKERVFAILFSPTQASELVALKGEIERLGWQPIETAPPIGTPRLLYWPPIPERDLDAHYAVLENSGGPFRHPTHWKALDEPTARQALTPEKQP